MAKQITCACGYMFSGQTDDELWEKAQDHIRWAHPEMTGKVQRDDILGQAELI